MGQIEGISVETLMLAKKYTDEHGGGGGGGASGDSAFIPSIGSLATISTGTSWSGGDPYTSTVTLTGYTVTGNTMVSVLPSSDVIEQMVEDGTTNIFISNNNGTLTANAIGAAPTAAMTLHVLCTESDASAELGNLPNIVGDGVLETLQATDLTDAINQLSSDLDDAKNAIGAKAPIIINTASGDIASFADGADGMQIRKIVGTIVPQQSGTGDPSPDNVRPISGWTGANVEQRGKNLLDPDELIQGLSTFVWGYKGTGFLFKAGVTYTVSVGDNVTVGSFRIVSVDEETVYAQSTAATSYRAITYTPEADTYGVLRLYSVDGIAMADVKASAMIEIGSSRTEYVTYQGSILPINWQTEAGTIYGGTVTLNEDGSADVVATIAGNRVLPNLWPVNFNETRIRYTVSDMLPANTSEAVSNQMYLCNRFPKVYGTSSPGVSFSQNSDGSTAFIMFFGLTSYGITNTLDGWNAYITDNEVFLTYILATPQTYHFDNIGQLYTYFGTNNVWIDTGAITECDYPADTKLYIDGLTEPDEDMIADGLIASGKYFTVNNQLYLSTAQIAAGAQIIPGSNCTATNLVEALNALNT